MCAQKDSGHAVGRREWQRLAERVVEPTSVTLGRWHDCRLVAYPASRCQENPDDCAVCLQFPCKQGTMGRGLEKCATLRTHVGRLSCARTLRGERSLRLSSYPFSRFGEYGPRRSPGTAAARWTATGAR